MRFSSDSHVFIINSTAVSLVSSSCLFESQTRNPIDISPLRGLKFEKFRCSLNLTSSLCTNKCAIIQNCNFKK